MGKELVVYLGLWLGETPTFQMKEPCCHSEDYLCGRQRRAARSGPGRDLSAKIQYIQAIYDSLCDGPSTVVQGGGIMLRGSLLAHYRRQRGPGGRPTRAAKRGGMASPTRGRR